jgi:DNA-binding PadR family transcriptional regulator
MGATGLSETSRAAMRSPINWALLGLLIRRPGHGYELTQRLERAYPGTLEVSSRSQIYTALDSLARRGLIEPARGEALHDHAHHHKVQYRPTVAGLQAYEQWLVEQVSGGEQRTRTLGQHLAALAPEHALQMLERCAEICLLAAGRPPSEDEHERRPGDAGALAERLAGEEGRLRAGAMLSWIEYARSELRAAAGESAA